MPSFNASLGISQLSKLNKFIKKKKKIFNFYIKAFDGEDFEIIKPIKHCKPNFWLTTLKIKNKSIKKNKLVKFFNSINFFVRGFWEPIHKLDHFKNCPKMNLDNTIYVYKNYICLPSSSLLKL